MSSRNPNLFFVQFLTRVFPELTCCILIIYKNGNFNKKLLKVLTQFLT